MILTQKPANTGPLSATIRRLYDAVEELRPLDSEDILVDPTVKGFRLRLKRRSGGGGSGGKVEGVELEELSIIDMDQAGEWVVTAPLVMDGTDRWVPHETERRAVGLPWDLRPSKDVGSATITYPADKREQRRTIRVSGFAVTERITPNYTRGQIIVAAKLKEPLRRSVPTSNNNGVLSQRFQRDVPEVQWVDLNIDGRRWDIGYKRVTMCENGRNVFVVVKGV